MLADRIPPVGLLSAAEEEEVCKVRKLRLELKYVFGFWLIKTNKQIRFLCAAVAISLTRQSRGLSGRFR